MPTGHEDVRIAVPDSGEDGVVAEELPAEELPDEDLPDVHVEHLRRSPGLFRTHKRTEGADTEIAVEASVGSKEGLGRQRRREERPSIGNLLNGSIQCLQELIARRRSRRPSVGHFEGARGFMKRTESQLRLDGNSGACLELLRRLQACYEKIDEILSEADAHRCRAPPNLDDVGTFPFKFDTPPESEYPKKGAKP